MKKKKPSVLENGNGIEQAHLLAPLLTGLKKRSKSNEIGKTNITAMNPLGEQKNKKNSPVFVIGIHSGKQQRHNFPPR